MSLSVLGTRVKGAIRSIMTIEVKAQTGDSCEPANGRYTIAVPKPENPLTSPEIKAPIDKISSPCKDTSDKNSPRKDAKNLFTYSLI